VVDDGWQLQPRGGSRTTGAMTPLAAWTTTNGITAVVVG
jgi:hypothetical protein